MPQYYVNREDFFNPSHNHEVHKSTCSFKSNNSIYLGEYSNAVPAVAKAKQTYRDADGCATCCPEAHRE